MITYKIIHHIPGRIRIKVPDIKNLSMTRLLEVSKQFSFLFTTKGIENVRLNPFSGSIVIKYKPEEINIIEYLTKIASSIEIQKLIRGQY